MAGLFQVLWGKADSTFKKAAVLEGSDGKPLEIPCSADDIIIAICTRPYAVDWDGDADLDLVVGNFKGSFYLFDGEGGGKFAPKPVALETAGVALQVTGAHGDPFVVDWDKDGDLDLLSGTSVGGVQWAENTAGPKKPPALKLFEPLIAIPTASMHECRPNEVTEPGGSTRIWVADVNDDGKLDILVGDCVSLIAPANGLSEADFALRRASWQAAMDAAQKDLEQAGADHEKMQLVQQGLMKLYEERTQFMAEDRTGFVWLYVQK